MDSQVKYNSLSQPPSIHASPINYNYNRTCNTTYNSPIGTPYHLNSHSPYNQKRQLTGGNYQDNYPENYQQFNNQNLNYQVEQPINQSQQQYYNSNPANFNQQQLNYSTISPYNQTVDPYQHYGAQHQLPHSLHSVSQTQAHGFPFYDDPGSPITDRDPLARPATAAGLMHSGVPTSSREMRRRGLRSSYSLDRGDPLMAANAAGVHGDPYITRDWSLERLETMLSRQQAAQQANLMGHHSRARDRSLERGMYLNDPYLQQQHAAQLSNLTNPLDAEYLRDPILRNSNQLGTQIDRGAYSRDSFIAELQARLNELQTQYGHVKRELDATTQKLGSSMHSNFKFNNLVKNVNNINFFLHYRY